VEEEHGEKRTRLASAHGNPATFVRHLERPQDPELHPPGLPARDGAGCNKPVAGLKSKERNLRGKKSRAACQRRSTMSSSTPKVKPDSGALDDQQSNSADGARGRRSGSGPKGATMKRTAAHLITVASATIVVGLLSITIAVGAPTNPGRDTDSPQRDDASGGVTIAGRTPAEISHQRALMAIPSVRRAVALERRRLRSPHQAALMAERAFVDALDTPASPPAAAPADGFDWGDAGIGAVATLTLLGFGTVALVVSRRSRTHRRPVITS
jgi:hypothetical protein